MSLDDFFAETTEPVDPLRADLIEMIQARHDATPRHMQVELGPSEVAHPCMRKMAFGMMQVPRCNPEYDPLPSILGVAGHTWLQSAAEHANDVLGRERWLTETRVKVTEGLEGNSDLYDRDTATVIDWKLPGYTQFDKYRRDPGPQYKMQVFLYGKGFEDAGLPVKRVAISFLSRTGTLRKMHLWQANYDRKIAEYGLRKRDATIAMIHDFDVEHHPERYQWIPMTPFDCVWCPWWKPEPKSPLQCPGDA
jgi:hypothetical protein